MNSIITESNEKKWKDKKFNDKKDIKKLSSEILSLAKKDSKNNAEKIRTKAEKIKDITQNTKIKKLVDNLIKKLPQNNTQTEGLNLFLSKIITEGDNNNPVVQAATDLNNEIEIIYNKKASDVFGRDFLDVLITLDKSDELIQIINKNEKLSKAVINELKKLDEGAEDQKISVEEFDAGFKERFSTYKATPELVAAICCLAALMTKYKSIFNQDSTLKQTIVDSNKITSIEVFIEKDKTEKEIFEKFYKKNGNGYVLNKEYKTLSDILSNFGNYRLSDKLAEKFTSFEASKEVIVKALKGEISFGHGGINSPEEVESKELGKSIDKKYKEISDIVGEPIDKIEDKASDETKEKVKKAEEELGGSNPDNTFGLGVSIPRDKALTDRESIKTFIIDLSNAFKNRLQKLNDSYSKIKEELKNKSKEKKDKDESEKNKYADDLVRECLKKFSFVLKEEVEVENLQEDLNKLFNKHIEYFESRTQDFTKTVSKLCEKYQECSNYNKSIDIRIEIFNAYVDYSYFAAKTIKGLKKEVDILTKEVNEKIDDLKPEWEDPKKKEWEDKKHVFDTDKKYEALERFLIESQPRDIGEITRYLLVNILTDTGKNRAKGTDEVIKLINGNCSAVSNYLYIGSSGAIYATDKNSVKGTDGKVADLSNMKAVPYKNVPSLITAAGLKMSVLSRDVIKKLFDNLKNNSKDLEDVKTRAERYTTCCDNIKNELKRASSNSSTVTEGLFDFKRKAKFDGAGNGENGVGFNKFSTTNKSDINKKQFLKNNSYSINLPPPKGTNGYQFKGDGPEDIALRQLLKGLVAIKGEGDSWYVMSGDSYKQYLKLKDDSSDTDTNSVNNNETKDDGKVETKDNSRNIKTGVDYNEWNWSVKTKPKVSVTTDAVDSTYPTAAQQRIKKICYEMGNDGRVTIKSKEFFDK